MRIIIDARFLGLGSPTTILNNLFKNLDFNENEYTVIGDKKELLKFNYPFKIIEDKNKPNTIFNYINSSLAKLINSYDAFFTPSYIIPNGITINSYCIFNDVSYIDYYLKHKKKKWFIKSYRVATKIFTFSEYSKKIILKKLGKLKEIVVIKPNYDLNLNIKKDVNKESNYYVFVGSLESHKNLKLAVSAFLDSKCQYDLHLIVNKNKFNRKQKKYIDSISKYSFIKIKYNLKDEEYYKELANSRGLIQPSLSDGFSFSILDAINLKIPVIASDIPLFRECFKNNNLNFFNPNIEGELVEMINFKKLKNSTSEINTSSNKEPFKEIVKNFVTTKKNIHIKRNFIFNLIYQMLVVLTPLITVPYISRILGANNIGVFSFSFTIASYFVIFAYLGFQQYSQRAIAECENDKIKQSKVFWELFLVRLVPASISLVALFVLYVLGIFQEYSNIVIIFSIIIVGSAFDINYYFHGKENYFFVMIINLIIRLFYLILVFVLIKSRYDLWIYALLYSMMVFLSFLTMWLALPLNLRKVRLEGINFKKHIKNSFALFLPVAAVSIYAILDKTLIGLMVTGQTYVRVGYITVIAKISDVENGYYYQAERIIRAILSILLAFGTVMSSRNTIEYSNKKLGAVKSNIYKSFVFVFALGVPLVFGTALVSNYFVPIFFGVGYDKVGFLMSIYSPVILLIGCSNILGIQYLLPTKKDIKYSAAVLSGFALNLILNLILIPLLKSDGAIIGTLISEFIILFIEVLMTRKEINYALIFKFVYKYLIAGAIMFTAGFLVSKFLLEPLNLKSYYYLIILVPYGIIMYYLVLMILRDKYIFNYTKVFFIKIYNIFNYTINHVIGDKTMETLYQLSNSKIQIKDKAVITIKKKQNGKRRKH